MLQYGPQSGYDLDKQMQNYVNFIWTTNQSQVYRTLYKLKDKGWVEIETIYQEDNPNKKVYHLTDEGLAELKKWMATPGHEILGRNPFLAQIMWGELISAEEEIAVLEARLAHVEEMLALLESRQGFPDGIESPLPEDALVRGVSRNALALDYGIRDYRSQRDWLLDAIKMLQMAKG
jgi:DNA-binding PadR family transcriptional regulator